MKDTMIGTNVIPTASPPAMPPSFVPSTKHFIAANRLTAPMGILLMLMLLLLVAAASLAVQAGTTTPGSHSVVNASGRAAKAHSQGSAPALTATPTPATRPNARSAPAAIPTQPPILQGSVTYRTSSTKIAGVTVAVAGPSSMQDTTNANGLYNVTIFADGLHTVTPSLSGQVNGISSFDAAFIAQCVTGLRAMSECPLLTADISNNNVLNSFDAALIAQYMVGVADANNRVGRWVFDPTNRSYDTGTSNLLNENFAGYLVGEVSGNWQPPAAKAAQQANQGQMLLPYQQHLPLISKD